MKNLSDRQVELLQIIVDYYIKNSIPVGSKQITEYMDLSSATLRNEMAELEEMGFLHQPHISSGRIPTEDAYKVYVNKFLNDVNKASFKEILLDGTLRVDDKESLKQIAKNIAEILNLAVVVAFDKNNTYHTGISKLFTQAEFKRDYIYLTDFSSLLDHLDEKIFSIFDKVNNDVSIYFGSENPFSELFGTVITKTNNNLIAIIGPLRMDYIQAIRILNEIKKNN